MGIIKMLDTEGIDYQVDVHRAIKTPQELAAINEIAQRQVVKPVVVQADDTHIMCALPTDREVDLEALRSLLQCQELVLVAPEDVNRICEGCEPGAYPPVGRLFGLDTVMDESFRDVPYVFFGAGTCCCTIYMSTAEFERFTQAKVGRITSPSTLNVSYDTCSRND
jgi:Ala-tRNA(Pro) deacylase